MGVIGNISLKELSVFFSINIILIFIGIIIWYYMWVKKYGIEIPNQKLNPNDNLSFMNSKDFFVVIQKLFERIREFDESYYLNTIGYDGYIYLLFQKQILSLLITILIFSLIFSALNTYFTEKKEGNFLIKIEHFLTSNNEINEITIIFHIISIYIYTFLHIRFISKFKTEISYLYFNKFDKMSRVKNSDWLRCRTLHISGLGPRERNIESLIVKLNYYLQKEDIGKVIDINFIPDYREIINLDKEKSKIINISNLIDRSKKSCYFKFFFPKIYKSEESVKNELNKIENKIQNLIKKPVYTSGHAFVCCDSLLSAYELIKAFNENTFKKLSIKLNSIIENFRRENISRNIVLSSNNSATFQIFQDEELFEENDLSKEQLNVNIIVDQMIEPFDIIWLNVGGDRGLYIFRRILCNLLIVIILILLTYYTSFISSQKVVDFLISKRIKMIIFNFPYGYIILTYIPPFCLLIINLTINYLIALLCRFETHYTHSNYQLAIFNKSYIYLLFNLFIIPGFTLSFDTLYYIYIKKLKIEDLVSKVYFSNVSYFFITLIIQNGTISSIYYLNRMNELLINSFSTFITFYDRHFMNLEGPKHRGEKSCFFYGFFYSLILVYYTICLVFSSIIPLMVLASIYMFYIKYYVDNYCLIVAHGCEMDSNGKLINKILNYSYFSLFIFHICMISFFFVKKYYTSSIFILVLLILSIIYFYYQYTDYIFDVYKFHEQLINYDKLKGEIGINEINNWRNKFRHPLVIPVFTKEEKNI